MKLKLVKNEKYFKQIFSREVFICETAKKKKITLRVYMKFATFYGYAFGASSSQVLSVNIFMFLVTNKLEIIKISDS